MERVGVIKAGLSDYGNVYIKVPLESGVDLRYTQELLGHRSSKTTEIYTHMSKANIASMKSPLDNIMEVEK